MFQRFLQYALMTILCPVVQVALAQTDSLKITYDPTKSGDSCIPLGVNKMYMHSGAGTSSPSAGWEFSIGNWGIDDGIGQMNSAGTDIWTKTIHVYNYYSQAANGPIPPGETVYSIAMSFRNANASAIGKDKNCQDLYIRQVNTENPVVENSDGTLFNGVVAEWVHPTGKQNLGSIGGLTTYPNPSKGPTSISYALTTNAELLSITVYSTIGQKVATLFNGAQKAGSHQITWNGSTSQGGTLEPGLYLLILNNGNSQITHKLMITP